MTSFDLNRSSFLVDLDRNRRGVDSEVVDKVEKESRIVLSIGGEVAGGTIFEVENDEEVIVKDIVLVEDT